MNSPTYLTTDEPAARIKCESRTIRERLKDSVPPEGVHYVRPFGGRKILRLRKTAEKEMPMHSEREAMTIPMTNGGVRHG